MIEELCMIECNIGISFEMNKKPITLVSLTPKQIYEEQLKLKKKMVEKESLYIKRTFFANKALFCFYDDAIH
jgi:hypothetical protein